MVNSWKRNHQHRYHNGKPEPACGRVIGKNAALCLEAVCYRLPTNHNSKHADICTNSGEGTDFFAHLLVNAEAGNHGPIGNVVKSVGNIPQDIGNAEDHNEPVAAKSEICKQHQIAKTRYESADEHRGLKLAPFGVPVVHDKTHKGVVYCIKHAQNGEHKACCHIYADGEIEHV